MNERDINRRRFLQRSSATIAAGALIAAHAPSAGSAAEDKTTTDKATADRLIAGKDPRLIVHVTEPPEIETPLSLLREARITPASLLFVRSNQPMPGADTLKPAPGDNWRIEIAGLREGPAKIALADVAKLPQVEVEMVLQCSGNGRAYFSAAAPAKGAQWQAGAMGNVRFGGVPLAKVLEHFQIEPQEAAKFLTAEGRDAPGKPGEADFEHSIPLDDALARSLLALSMNGEPLPAVHGGPVRLVTPGYYATMNVKWLSRLRFEARETENYHQVGRYRTPKEPLTPGEKFTSTLENSDPNWRMRVKSVIFAPLDGETLPAGKTNVRGVAFGDGSTKIETVLVATSPDGPWLAAKIKPNDSPYAWQHWSLDLDLQPGKQRILARATDAQGRSQPLTAAADWNPAGYAYHAADSVHVVVQ